MRTISNLLIHEGRIYVNLASKNLSNLFLKHAEEEGFTFGDGVKPTEREADNLYTLNPDWTISYVGYIGRIAFRATNLASDTPIFKIDYARYLVGNSHYLME